MADYLTGFGRYEIAALREAHHIRASGVPAHGSHLGCLTANRLLGQGRRVRGFGMRAHAAIIERLAGLWWTSRRSDF